LAQIKYFVLNYSDGRFIYARTISMGVISVIAE
jgi:hypothetical protein